MPAPTVPYKVLAKGYRVRGGQDGLHATVPCIVNWSDAFVFHDDVLGFPKGVKGSMVYQIPWRFPGAPLAPMYAISCDIEPIGAGGAALPAPYGVMPGQFFPNAICTVEFATRQFLQVYTDDPGFVNQLDPSNPIIFCTQTIKGGGRLDHVKGINYVYDDGSNEKIIQDIGVYRPEAKIVLEYPWVPFQPWQAIQAYVGQINSVALFGCAAGTLLFEEFDSEARATTQGFHGQRLVYSLAYNPDGWNKMPKPSGTMTLVKKADGSGDRIYASTDLRAILV